MDDKRTFIECFIDVVYKLRNGEPMMAAKEELMDDFIEQWCEIYGDETVV